MQISIDIETYSNTDLKTCGIYKYTEDENFEVLLFSYSVDGGPVKTVDIALGEKIPGDIVEALQNPDVIKCAFNASFERVCLSKHLGILLEPEGWHCTMVWAATLGLPLSLEGVGAVLQLDKQKSKEGGALIKLFCMPHRGSPARVLPTHDLFSWERFKHYNVRDVETEMAIQQKLSRFPVPQYIWEEYWLDQHINDRGIGVDTNFVEQAVTIDRYAKNALWAKMQECTNLENPNSVQQLTGWLKDSGLKFDSLDKKSVRELLRKASPKETAVLMMRQQLARSSVSKYTAMQNAVSADGRARGMFQYYGANRTGRWAGRRIQLQNLPQNHMSDLAQARNLVAGGDYGTLELLYPDMLDTLAQLIRTAFVPQEGKKFIVADFSAIEARVIAWLAGEKWRMEVFAAGGDIYCASASQMFRVPVEKNGINSHLRQKGKIAELALGYGGSAGALKAMGALDMGLTEKELYPLVQAWRNANPAITALWWDVDRAVKKTVKLRITTETHGIKFTYESGFLFITLPSGRRLAYVKPRIGSNRFGGESVTYEGLDSAKKWNRLESYGPKFCENITQATARDLLMHAMMTLKNCSIVAHVHDEIIIEADKRMSVEAVCDQMSRSPSWAEGLQLTANGYECEFYRKD